MKERTKAVGKAAARGFARAASWGVVIGAMWHSFGWQGGMLGISIACMSETISLALDARKSRWTAEKALADIRLIEAQARRAQAQADRAAAEERNDILDATMLHIQVSKLEIDLATATTALAEVDGHLALDRDAIVGTLQVVIETLLAIVDGFGDKQRAHQILDAVEQIRMLCGELDDDEKQAARTIEKIDAIHAYMTAHSTELVEQVKRDLSAR